MARFNDTWWLSEELKTAHRELNKAREWLKATEPMIVPIPTPMEDVAQPDSEDAKAPPASKKKSKVAELDLIEHALTSGGWEGTGAVRKVGEIRIGVSSGLLCDRDGRL